MNNSEKSVNKTQKVLLVVANHASISLATASKKSDIAPRDVGRILSLAVDRGRISRIKLPHKSYYRYYMTDDQKNRVLRFTLGTFTNVVLEVPMVDIPSRLKFLNSLQETVHKSNPVLKAIIDDYHRTMRNAQIADSTVQPSTLLHHEAR